MSSFHMKAVGVTFGNRQRVISKLSVGQRLKFVLEPENKFDKFAIQIMTLSNEPVGYVSKDYNKDLFERISHGQHYNLTVSAITGGGFDSAYGVNILVEY